MTSYIILCLGMVIMTVWATIAVSVELWSVMNRLANTPMGNPRKVATGLFFLIGTIIAIIAPTVLCAVAILSY